MKKLALIIACLMLLACRSNTQESTPHQLGAVQPLQFGPDIDGGYVSQEVTGIWAHPIPQPTVGSLQWDGGSYYWSPTAGSIAPGTAGQALFTNDAGTATQWATCSQDIACSATTIGQMALQSITPSGGTSTIVPFNAGGFKLSTSPWVLQDPGAVTRFSLETAHGLTGFGNGGTDAVAYVGPYTAINTDAAFYGLAHGVAAGTNNYAFLSDGSNVWFNIPSTGSHMHFYNANTNNLFDAFGTGTTTLQTGTGQSAFIFGTNASGASVQFQADAAANILQLYGGTQNSVALGANVAGVGHWRTPAGMQWLNRNSVNSADHLVIGDNGANELDIGSFALPFPQMRIAATALSLSSGTTTFGDGTGATVATWSLVNGGLTTIQLPGAITVTTRTITGNLTVDTTTTDNIIIVDTTSGAITVTLPAPTNGRALTLIDKANTFQTHNCTLARHASEKINGFAGSIVYSAQGTRATITSDGTDWYTY